MYDQLYGFTERPFQPSADPHFFVETATHGEALSYLDYGLAQASGAVLIHGAAGTGKTILARYWLEGLDEARFHILDMTRKLDASLSFAEHLSELLDLPDSFLTIDQWLMAVTERLRDEIWAGRRSLLIVDDVEQLPTEALAQLQLLAALHHDGQALLQIFLFGESRFELRLRQDGEMASLRNMIGASHGLSLVGVDEVEQYVYHRLSKVGWDDRPIFRQDAFAILLAQSGAIPARINMILTRVLLNGALEEVREVTGAHVAQAVAELTSEQKLEPLPQPTASAPATTPAPAPAPAPIVVEQPLVSQTEYRPEPVLAAEPALESAPSVAFQSALAAEVARAPEPLIVNVAEIEAAAAVAASPEPSAAPSPQFCAMDHPNFSLSPLAAPSEAEELAELRRRVDELEAKLLEQDAAMRRMIHLLMNWVETDGLSASVATEAAMALAGRHGLPANDPEDVRTA